MSLFKTEIVKNQLNRLLADLQNLNFSQLKIFIFKNFNTIVTVITLVLVWQTFEITKAQFDSQQENSFEAKKLIHIDLLQGQMAGVSIRLQSANNAIHIYENLNEHGKEIHKKSCRPISENYKYRDELNSINKNGMDVFSEIRNLEFNRENALILDNHVKNTPDIILVENKMLSKYLDNVSTVDPCIETARRLSKSPL